MKNLNLYIKTIRIPLCRNCNSQGILLQDNIVDPDCKIHGTWAFKQCSNSNCGLVWLDPAPMPNELWKAYTSYHTHTRLPSNNLSKAIISIVNRLVRLLLMPVWIHRGLWKESRRLRLLTLGELKKGKLLDVGCGGGRFLWRMQRLGWQVTGIDFDAKATNSVTKRYGIETYTGDLLDAKFPASHFDAITLSHTIEHLIDPRAILIECFRILKSSGRIVITTPNVESNAKKFFGASWRGWEAPRHLQLFSVASLARSVSECGFDVIEARSSAVASAIIYQVSFNTHRGSAGQQSFFSKVKVLIWSYFQELVDFDHQKSGRNLAQNLLLVAEKPALQTVSQTSDFSTTP